VILAGDVCYERSLAARVLPWLQGAHARGARVLIGDPGRDYFSREGLIPLAEYQVPATRELEDREVKRVGVFTFPA
jgi:predicted nicotinamide N-methyase